MAIVSLSPRFARRNSKKEGTKKIRRISKLTWESSSVNIASKANIFGAATVGLRSSAEEDCPAVGSTNVTCFFLLSALKKLPPSPGDTFSITFTCNQDDEKTVRLKKRKRRKEREGEREMSSSLLSKGSLIHPSRRRDRAKSN